MTKTFASIGLVSTLVASFCVGPLAFGQSNADQENQKVTSTILHLDSLFWDTYNFCHTENTGQYLTDDVEFYHDKGGITNGKDALIESIKKNICGNPDQKVRREPVPGTVKVFPLRNGPAVYGAIISGDHYFYVTEPNKPEVKTGLAKFSQLWILKDDQWKMSVILSYDHGPAPYVNTRKEIKLSPTEMKAYAGNFKSDKFGAFNFKINGSRLLMDGSGFQATLYPQGDSIFFLKDRDLQFEFVRDEKGQVNKIIVHENGQIVDELLRY